MKETIIGFVFCALVIVIAFFVIRHFIRWLNDDLPSPPKEEERPPRSSRRPRIEEL